MANVKNKPIKINILEQPYFSQHSPLDCFLFIYYCYSIKPIMTIYTYCVGNVKGEIMMGTGYWEAIRQQRSESDYH